ncbi:unnamed protein product [Ostreobium quekettii]|uniref:Uncharacterized protein n=1 Tax=Ostreobium quekettii TaxID=121088 RepID=A0A8S1J5M3_9CHLO|nr:unnamed protein product [Ostreobium quekettii]
MGDLVQKRVGIASGVLWQNEQLESSSSVRSFVVLVNWHLRINIDLLLWDEYGPTQVGRTCQWHLAQASDAVLSCKGQQDSVCGSLNVTNVSRAPKSMECTPESHAHRPP